MLVNVHSGYTARYSDSSQLSTLKRLTWTLAVTVHITLSEGVLYSEHI